jgi:hypothetical protein
MLLPREVVIRLALERFKGIYKLHVLEKKSHFLKFSKASLMMIPFYYIIIFIIFYYII